jgi:hypothetical protein
MGQEEGDGLLLRNGVEALIVVAGRSHTSTVSQVDIPIGGDAHSGTPPWFTPSGGDADGGRLDKSHAQRVEVSEDRPAIRS